MTPQEYIDKNYYLLKNEFRNIVGTDSDTNFEDFYHDCLLIFLEHPKAVQVVEDNVAKFFLIRIGLNNWRSKTSPFHKKYRLPFEELTPQLVPQVEEYDIEEDVMIDVVLMSLDDMYNNEQTRYKAIIIILYHSLGNNYSEVERQFEIPRTTVRNLYNSGIQILKQHVTNNLKSIENGHRKLSSTLSTIVNDWCDSIGSDEQQTVSMVSELFKTKYFQPAKL
jgi:DNA-directed RNA polymerase specialized sigma24 family protein